ncbi:MAG: LPS export ABC transporter permease LptG [Betaproteobacteria bacterium]|nr:LPS export ABC transporter permease LptG [Betaproteobacteria bacterium]MCL2885799.1 LPS export ABC transporter permease LptG [Betaproteobacteria bacterium]
MFRRRIYQRYVMRETFAAVFLVLLAFLALFSFFDLINELRSVGKSYPLGYAILTVALSLPSLIYELIPIAALIGALYALSTLARHSEITVLRASGLATRDLLLTLFRVAGVLALLTFIVGEALVPYTERLSNEIKVKAMSGAIARQGGVSGLWVKDGRSFINIRMVMPDSALHQVLIYKFDPDNALESVTNADEAHFDKSADVWRLSNVSRTSLFGDSTRVEQLPELGWTSAVTPDLLSVLMVAPERMTLFGLVNFTRHLTENRQQTERYEIAIWKKLIYPLTALVMVALALPFGYSHNRVGGVSLKIFAGVMLGILFYALNGLFSNLGIINAWPPLASATAPSILFMLAAAGMLWWVERR